MSRPHWNQETPRSALRIRTFCAGRVREQLAVDRIRDPSLQAAHCFHRFLAGGALVDRSEATWYVLRGELGVGDEDFPAPEPLPVVRAWFIGSTF